MSTPYSIPYFPPGTLNDVIDTITFKGIEGASLDIYLLSTTFILIFLICRYGIRNKKF
jgi:hypothetical protein